MSSLQCANIHLESTANNRIQYDGSNGMIIVAGGTNIAAVNSTVLSTNNAVVANNLSVGGNNINPLGFMKNRIINGDMRIDQRYSGTATANTISAYTVDRWAIAQSTVGKLIGQQNAGSITPPAGFSNYYGITSQSSYSLGANDYYWFTQPIEGFNLYDLAWGTSSAKPITVSFWVRSSLTGTFGLTIYGVTSSFRTYPATYTISSPNTWQYITITIPGDTSQPTGGWPSNSSAFFYLMFGLGAGSTYSSQPANTWNSVNTIQATGTQSLVGTSGATWYVTGVQLEVGSVATPFERRQYGAELQLCQRYYEVQTADASTVCFLHHLYSPASNYWHYWYLKVTKRAAPTLTKINGTWNNATPSLTASVDVVTFQAIGGQPYLTVTSGLVGYAASAEL